MRSDRLLPPPAALLAALLAILLVVSTARPAAAEELVRASLVAEPTAVAPGQTFTVAIRMAMKPGWHVYWRNPGDSGLPPEMAWSLPPGAEAGPVAWPAPERIPVQTLMNYGYEGEVALLVPVTAPADLAPGGSLRLTGRLGFLVCEAQCVPGSADLVLSVPTASAPGAIDPAQAELFARTRAVLPVPPDAPARFRREDGRVILALDRPGPTADAVSQAAFFPYAETVLDNAAPQTLTVDRTGLRLALTPVADATPPAEIAGVLTFVEGGVRRVLAIGLEPGAASPPPANRVGVPGEAGDAPTLLGAIGLALLGGLVLNLMPCVFPVLSIKVLGLVNHSGQSPARVRVHGLTYTAGVLASFLALAGLLIALKAGGATIGWGFQLQSPIVVAILAYGLTAMGLSLSGVVHVGSGVAGLGDGLTRRGGYQGSFFTGVLATLVATPCTAPFMGAAVGYALTQAPAVALAVFASLGLGLALPFLVLTAYPAALRALPRPGAWMDTLKGVLAFPVYATAAWLVWVLAQQVGPNGLLSALLGLVLVGLAAWTWERARSSGRIGAGVAWATALAALAAVAGTLVLVDRDRASAGAAAMAEGVEPFTQARLDALRADGRTVFVDMTAAWCITCQVNERTTLAGARVRDAFRERAVAYLKGDWTNQNPEITRLLERNGRSGVPLYLVYRGRADPQVLPQILTEGVVLAALEHPASR